MPEKRILDLLKPTKRFLRSAHLERDFEDPSAFAGYVVTDFTRSCLHRMANGLGAHSGQRAWRVTGDYGSGKSSFALLLAHWFGGRGDILPRQVRQAIGSQRVVVPRPNLVPALVTCSRQALGVSILNALHQTLSRLWSRHAPSKLAMKVQALLDAEREPTDDQILQLVLEANSRIVGDAKGKGLLLVLDELGKFLEFAAMHSQRQDVFLLQRLAEAASRSGDEPLFIVSLLHQGFNAYADQLNQAAQREWEKVAGRFEEIVFDQPVEQIANVIASAVNVRVEGIPRAQSYELKYAMERAVASGWFPVASAKSLSNLAVSLYPLHPTVLPVLIRTFRRFGQNERSLFSFLLSNEPFGLQAFSEIPIHGGDLYRLHNFYDYVRTNFGHRLTVQSYRSHWNLIDSVVESFATEDELHLTVLKTIGILNLLNDSDLLPTEETVVGALAGEDHAAQRRVRTAIEKLRTGKHVLYDRGRARGLCLWPHTCVDLEKAYDDAKRAVDTPHCVAAAIKDSLETRAIIARRHYIETGNLRHWAVHYCSVQELAGLMEKDISDADGIVVVPLCETPTEREVALACVKRLELKDRPNWLVAVPQPLANLSGLVQEVQRWEWISSNTLELNADKYAREEVSRQKAAVRSQLDRRIQDFIGFKQFTSQTMLDWFHQGHPLEIKDGRHLLSVLSRIFDETYHLAPRIHNELVNRRTLSSAAAAARMRLIERMLAAGGAELLGMNPAKKPPEMSMYLSVLKKSGLHRKCGDTWVISEPHGKTDDACHVLPTLHRIREIIRKEPDRRVKVAELVAGLRKPPYGVRDGITPLLLTVFAIAHGEEVAFYKDGSFLRELSGETMLVLTKAPERFDIQYCKVEGVRADLFEKLVFILEITTSDDGKVQLLEVVKKLCLFVAQLPAYVLNTNKLSRNATAVRDAILNAREPVSLVFTDLPKACQCDPILAQTAVSKCVPVFVKALRAALDELRAAYPELQERLRRELRTAFDLPGDFQRLRVALAARAEQILLSVTESRLRAFCLRLMDANLPESDWLESLGSFLSLKPPSKWHDAEEEAFRNELSQITTRFHRVESIVFAGGELPNNTVGVRVAITQSNGVEHEQVVHFSTEEEQQLRNLQRQFEDMLAKNRRLGLAAASRAIWLSLEKASKT